MIQILWVDRHSLIPLRRRALPVARSRACRCVPPPPVALDVRCVPPPLLAAPVLYPLA